MNRGEIVAMELVGGQDTLLTTPFGNKYILVMIDLFTRYVIAVPVPDMQDGLWLMRLFLNGFVCSRPLVAF